MLVHFLETIFCLSLFIVISVKSEIEVCRRSSETESSLCANIKNAETSRIEDWWQEMSIQKPIKCKTPKKWIHESPLLKLFSKQMPVVSYPCRTDETPLRYSFKGQVKEGRLDGLGKLKLGSKVLDVGNEDTCLKVNRVLGQDPLEIIGTFVNGYLEGNVKIVLGDGKVVIGNYVNGLAQGFRREWNENGTLQFAGFSHRGAKIGKAWTRIGKSLIYDDIATINRSDDLTVVIPNGDSIDRKILSGKYWPHIYTLADFYETEIVNVDFEADSCFLKLESKPSNKESESYFDVRFDTMISTCCLDKPLCEMYENQAGTVSQKLTGWFRTMNEDASSLKLHQRLLQMRQETTQPESQLKLISNVSFNNETDSRDPWVPPATLNVTFLDGEHSKHSKHSKRPEHSKVIVSLAGFDGAGRLHGLVELQLSSSSAKKSSEEKFGFALHNILLLRAVFNHGEVEGPAILTTKVFNFFLFCS
jgi:hypothetical protein